MVKFIESSTLPTSSPEEANKDAPVFWSNYYFLEGAENRACRHMHPEDNNPSYYKLVEDIFKLEDCQARRASGLEMADPIESTQICLDC